MTESQAQNMVDESRVGGQPDSVVLLFLGCERSGTTFVQETLSTHYSIGEGNETRWVIRRYPDPKARESWDQADQARYIQTVFSDWYFANKVNYHNIHFDYKDFIQEGPFDFSRFVEDVFRHIAAASQKQYVLNKTCIYCSNMHIVDEVHKNPRVAHVVRDGRDVALSLLAVKAWGPATIYGAARWWKSRVDGMQRYAKEHLDGRYLELKYEDLLKDPVAAFEQLTRFYGIYTPEGHNALVAEMKVIPGNSEKWRRALTARQIALFERVAGDTLLRNGYALATPEAQLKPLPNWLHVYYRAKEAILRRTRVYAVWLRALQLINRAIGKFPSLQRAFFRSKLFARHFYAPDLRPSPKDGAKESR